MSDSAKQEGQNSVSAWVDLASPSHPFFFASLLEEIPEIDATTTVRQKTETVDLADELDLDARVLGRDFDNTLLRKFGIPLRTAQLCVQAPRADVSLSSRNAMCILASKVRRIPSIHFTDNDITAYVDGLKVEELYNRFEAKATYNVVPEAFRIEELTRWGADPAQIITYGGYKEDIYIANFEPDEAFTEKLPFDEYVVVRPEALDAAYVDADRSLVPDLLEQFVSEEMNVVYLPRGRGDEAFANPYDEDRVYVPDRALNGLDLSWHSNGVLTGSGTMAREAACMEIPAVSFFPDSLLSVDRQMVTDGMVHHSRDATDIVDYITSRTRSQRNPDLSRSKDVLNELSDIVRELLHHEI